MIRGRDVVFGKYHAPVYRDRKPDPAPLNERADEIMPSTHRLRLEAIIDVAGL